MNKVHFVRSLAVMLLLFGGLALSGAVVQAGSDGSADVLLESLCDEIIHGNDILSDSGGDDNAMLVGGNENTAGGTGDDGSDTLNDGGGYPDLLYGGNRNAYGGIGNDNVDGGVDTLNSLDGSLPGPALNHDTLYGDNDNYSTPNPLPQPPGTGTGSSANVLNCDPADACFQGNVTTPPRLRGGFSEHAGPSGLRYAPKAPSGPGKRFSLMYGSDFTCAPSSHNPIPEVVKEPHRTRAAAMILRTPVARPYVHRIAQGCERGKGASPVA